MLMWASVLLKDEALNLLFSRDALRQLYMSGDMHKCWASPREIGGVNRRWKIRRIRSKVGEIRCAVGRKFRTKRRREGMPPGMKAMKRYQRTKRTQKRETSMVMCHPW